MNYTRLIPTGLPVGDTRNGSKSHYARSPLLQLPQGLDKGHTLDVSKSAPQLDDANVRLHRAITYNTSVSARSETGGSGTCHAIFSPIGLRPARESETPPEARVLLTGS